MKPQLSLIPLPKRADTLDAPPVVFTAASAIAWQGPDSARGVAELLAEYLRPATGFPWYVAPLEPGAPVAVALVQTDDPAPDAAGFLPEPYTLVANDGRVRIEAPSAAGLARAIQTLRQLFPPAVYAAAKQDREWSIPAVRIKDEPAFRWRGLHLDVCRHFFSADDVCRYIELLAQHRMNIFHWHLTEDQGWRIDIKGRPRLVEVGSVREKTLVGHMNQWPHKFDDTPYGGHYTQDEIRRVVAFAARRHVTVVPELDMPGHMSAAIAAYPELGNGFNANPRVRCTWGIAQEVLNLSDATVRFCKEVWSELFDLFPGVFYHIGGDEAPRREWEESDAAQRLMAERGLSRPSDLQAWFTREMDAFFRAHGHRLVGWDEIVESGGIDRSAAVMCWRQWGDGPKLALEGAKNGNDLVMALNGYTYFDYYQAEPTDEEPLAIGGLLPLRHVYTYDPLTALPLPAECRAQVLGGQGQLWTEYIDSRDKLDYMAYPRACALAERLWTPSDRCSYKCFSKRLAAHRERFAAQGVRACPVQ